MSQGNVLVSDTATPLISDFGMSRVINLSQSHIMGANTTLAPGGTIRWMAIEFFVEGQHERKHTTQTDVWAFGMTAYVCMLPELLLDGH